MLNFGLGNPDLIWVQVSIYLWSKVVCLFVLFCFVLYLWDPQNKDASFSHSWSSWSVWKALRRRGSWAWFHGVWTWGAEVLECWMISWLKIKLNRSWKFRRNWNMPLIHTLQNNLHLLSFPILWWVHTCANGTCHTSLYLFLSNQKIIEVSIPWYYLFSWSGLTLKYQSELILGKN
jgi:hypothetical protein